MTCRKFAFISLSIFYIFKYSHIFIYSNILIAAYTTGRAFRKYPCRTLAEGSACYLMVRVLAHKIAPPD